MELLTRNKDQCWDRIVNLYINIYDDLFTTINDKTTCKLILIKDGTGIAKIDKKSFIITSPMIICLTHAYDFSIIENNSLQSSVLYFKPDVINDNFTYSKIALGYFNNMIGKTVYQDYILLKNFFKIDNNNVNSIINLLPSNLFAIDKIIKNIQNELLIQKDSFWPCRSRSFFVELLFLINSITSEKKLFSKDEILYIDNTDIQNIICYLSENISKKITIEILSKKFITNRNKINKEFKKATGLTCLKYLYKMRMNLSSLLLCDTDLPIYEIGERIGFVDVNYFIKAFKSYYNITPTQFREKNRLNQNY